MNVIEETSNWIRNSITLKLAVIGVLVLVLLIPASMIQNLIKERSENHKKVVNEVTDKWGKSQVIAGPFLIVPYKVVRTVNNTVQESKSYAYFLPEKLNITGRINPEVRNRNIFKVMLYNSNLELSGFFEKPDFEILNISGENILWDEASIMVGIPDMRGIRRSVEIMWNNQKYTGNPGVVNRDIITSGINSRVNLNVDTANFNFSLNLDINGSESLSLLPLGKETHAKIESDWSSPSFSGAFLPEKRNITANGFIAEWNILQLNRNYPQQWTSNNNQSVMESKFGVDLIFPVDHYQKSTRSAKYAVMFLFLTFLTFFINEILNKSKIHPVQYLLIGLALIIFYTLLVSLSEYIGFSIAYIIASFLTVTLITVYSLGVLSKKGSLIVGIFLVLLYGFLFVLLQLEDYSLLIGSFGLFFILACVMRVSRKINWYATAGGKAPSA
jgi:inner membrane protein